MLIPMGILSAAGGPGADFELITTAYGTGGSGVITLGSIPATYKHLQLRVVARSTNADISNSITVRFNSDTGTNYSRHLLYGNASSVSSTNGASQNSITMNNAVYGANSTAGMHGLGVMDILDYGSTSKSKTTRSLTGGAISTDWFVALISGSWQSTSAINTITLGTSGSFATSTRVSLYGIKG